MAPIGTSKEIAMSDDQVIQHDEDAVDPAQAAEDALDEAQQKAFDEEVLENQDQPNR